MTRNDSNRAVQGPSFSVEHARSAPSDSSHYHGLTDDVL